MERLSGFCAFDIDGTLVRWKAGVGRQILCSLFEEMFRVDTTPLKSLDIAGKTDLQIYWDAVQLLAIPFEEAREQQERYFTQMVERIRRYCTVEHLQLLPGVRSLLQQLQEDHAVGIGILTGNIQDIARAKLETFDLWRFVQVGVYGNEAYQREELVQIFAYRLRQQFDQHLPFVIVGDSARDITAAKKAQVPVIAVATGVAKKEELAQYNPDALFENLANVPSVKERIHALCAR